MIPVRPLTTRAVERLGLRRANRHVHARGAIFVVQAGDAIVAGGPAPGAALTCHITPLTGAIEDQEAGIVAVGRAAREAGFTSSEVDLADPAPTLRQHGWQRVGGRYVQTTPIRNRSMRVVPVRQRRANEHVGEHHSHNSPAKGSFFAVGVEDTEGRLLCVAQAGTINARRLMESTHGLGAEVVRVASSRDRSEGHADPRDPHRNAASMSLSACVRTLLALGYRRIVSYTMLGELGWSYRVSGWRPVAVTRPKRAGSSWDRPSRRRENRPTNAGRKVRWEIGPDALELTNTQVTAVEATIRENLWTENVVIPRPNPRRVAARGCAGAAQRLRPVRRGP